MRNRLRGIWETVLAEVLGVFVVHRRMLKNVALLLLRTSVCARACVRAW